MQFTDSDIQIFQAFAKVAQRTASFSDITIKAIAEEVGISRQAMYQSHFRNTDELLTSLYYYVDQDIQDEIKAVVTERAGSPSIIHHLVYAVLPLIYDKRDFFQILYSDKINSTWNGFMEDRYSDLLLPLFQDRLHMGVVVPATVQSKVIIHEFIGLVSIWMNQTEPVLPESFAPILIYALNNSASTMINN